MTSERKIQANRQNARASTGPKTANGRARSAQNALRHGLSRSVLFNVALSKDVEALAQELAGPGAKAHVQERARRSLRHKSIYAACVTRSINFSLAR